MTDQGQKETNQPQKSKDPTRYRYVMTLGNAWAQLFEASLARKMSNIIHFNLGDPNFILTENMLPPYESKDIEYIQDRIKLVNSKSTQASDLVGKLSFLITHSDLILIDNKMLDTAIGQFILMVNYKKTWAVGVDDGLSPLAPYYLRGVFYPNTPDDLVRLVLNEVA